jgi:hypothetical protein
VYLLFLKDIVMFAFPSYESSLAAGEGGVSHLRLRRGMSEEVRPTHTCNGEYLLCSVYYDLIFLKQESVHFVLNFV